MSSQEPGARFAEFWRLPSAYIIIAAPYASYQRVLPCDRLVLEFWCRCYLIFSFSP
jgi:hypothetical protein